MADDLLARVGATGLLDAPRVLVLLSGGRDSVALLDVAARLRPGAVAALHCNYGLRGEDSEADERLCETLCERLGVPLEVVRPAAPSGGNLHAWAREQRYAAGRARCEGGGTVLAVAQTATDQAETVLYRLATSPGRRALLGMPEHDGVVVRPLLAAGITRAQTGEWCRAHDLPWADDVSNDDERFARARVRAGLVPALRAVDERAERAVLATARQLRDESALLDALVRDELGPTGEVIARERLAALHPALARLVLRELAERAAGRSCPRAAARLDEILALNDGALDVGDGARIVVAGDVVRAEPTPPLPRATGPAASLPRA